MAWQYRVAVLDLDGTVLDSQRLLLPEVEAEINRVRAGGVRVVLATGRPFAATEPLAKQLGLRLPVVVENGALVVDLETNLQLEYWPMARETLGEVLDIIERLPRFFVTVSSPGALLLEGDPALLSRAIFDDEPPPSARFVNAFDDFRVAEATKVWLCGPPASLDVLARETHSVPVTLARTLPDSVDVTAAGVSKLVAIERLVLQWGIAMNEVVAIGDSVNDMELLRGAGHGIAMGNASAIVRAAARAVTDDNDHAGVAVALREVFPAQVGGRGEAA